MTTLTVRTHSRTHLVDITDQVRDVVEKSGVRKGQVTVYVPHTTAGCLINENADPDVAHDLLMTLDRLAPREDARYKHAEGNSDAHLKTSMVGTSQTVFIEEGRLVLGTWQGIFLAEFDGPRSRSVHVGVLGSE